MSTYASLVSVHLAGEGKDEIVLDTLPGKFTITRTDEALTPYGGLAAWSGFLKHLGIIERLAEHCPVARTSPNAAPVREVLHSFLLGALVEGKRFCHVRWVMDDPAVATQMGLERVRGEDALPRLGKELDRESLRQWLHRPQTELYAALPERFIADWDATVNTRYGHQEDAAVGYNPHKRGRKSHHPLICVAARTRLCLHLEWRPGDTVSATDWQPAMEKLWSHPTIRERLWLNRGDVGFGQEAIMAWHEAEGQQRPKYLFKLKLTNNVRRAIARVPWPLWAGSPTVGCQQFAETTVRLQGWSRERRIVIMRTLKPTNPTPDGKMASESRSSPREIQNYLGRISGPLLDRIDLHIEVPQVKFREMSAAQTGDTSAQIRERVVAARKLQTARFAHKPKVTCNARMGARELKSFCELDESTSDLLKHAMTEYNLSARAYDRILKVARTIADLEASEKITVEHISEAIQYRSLDRQLWG